MELLYTLNYKGKETSEEYIKKALTIYGEKKEIQFKHPLEIRRTKKGKPYLKEDIHFSVSHSENLWVCLVAKKPVGIDVEKYRDKNYMKIAKRFFNEEESDYVINHGMEGFLSIWTRKEAYVKFHGSTLGENLRKIKTLQNGVFFDTIDSLYAKEIFIDKTYKCAYMTMEKEEVWISPMD